MSGLTPDAAGLLQRYLANLLRDPSDPKYRKIRLGNQKFASVVWAEEAARNLLEFAGWRQDIEDGFLVLPVEAQPDVFAMLLAEYAPPPTSAPAAPRPAAAAVQPSPAAACCAGPTVTPAAKAATALSPEAAAKQAAIDADRAKLMAKLKKEKERKKLLRQQMEADRNNVAGRVTRPSHRQGGNFGSNINRYGDIGVDLNAGGG